MAKKTPAKRPNSSTLRLALSQMACVESPRDNRARQVRLAESAGKKGARIFCTQEMFTSQYFCQVEDHRFFALAESIPGPSTDALAKVAKKYSMVIIASLFEKRASGLYHNTAAVIDADGSLLGIYRKMHIPDDPLYYEKFYFTPGDAGSGTPPLRGGSGAQPLRGGSGKDRSGLFSDSHGFRTWNTKHAKIGVLICWDQWYPEAARLTALGGAEILFYPTAIGWHPAEKAEYGTAQHESWELMMRSHAVANGCYVVAPNRIGHELIRGADKKPVNPDGIQFWGQSFICQPNGQLAAKASIDREEVLTHDADLGKVEFARTHWPFLRDRRIDAYGDMTKRFLIAP